MTGTSLADSLMQSGESIASPKCLTRYRALAIRMSRPNPVAS
jgi:hypothetical protein